MSDAPTSDDGRPTDVTDAEAPDEPDSAAPPRLDVRAVLDEIGAEDTLAHLEARVAGLEHDLERNESRARDADKARRGELDLMRARLEEALDLVRETMEDQRGSFHDFEERFAGLVTSAEESSRSFVDELREELTPRVQRAVHNADETKAELKGEIVAVANDIEARATAHAENLAAARRELESRLADLRAEVTGALQDREVAAGALEQRVQERLAAFEASRDEGLTQQDERLEALRRELDASAGELRAGLNLKSNELRDALGELHTELGQAIDDQADGAAELERRWIDGTKDIARRIEQVEQRLQTGLGTERDTRHEMQDELATRLDEVAGVVEELHGKVGSDTARRGTELESFRRDHDELANRLDVLQTKVAQAVSQIASQLTNRVAQLGGDLDAMRESTVRHQERLASIDHLERRIGELQAGQEQLAAGASAPASPGMDDDRLAGVESGIAELRQQVSALSGTVAESRQQTRDVAAGVSGLAQSGRTQQALRQEVRELAARTAEMTHRLEETEKLARAAGQAIASAVRKARSGSRAPASERASIFGDRPRTVQRDEQGEPIVGLDHLAPPAPDAGPAVSAEDLQALEDLDAVNED